MPFIKDRKNSSLIRSLKGVDEKAKEEAFNKLMRFFGDIENH